MSRRRRALISTLRPHLGGVASKTIWLCEQLESWGIEPVLAWYEPWSLSPELSVPAGQLLRGRRPGRRQQASAYGRWEGHALGAWLPELEFTHYRPGAAWRELIAGCDFHLAVSGNALCAAPYARLGVPFLLWLGTPWRADRADRVRKFPLSRRLLDRIVNAPRLARLERRILRAPGGRVLCISHYTARALEAIAGRPMDGVLIRPVDRGPFQPLPERVRPWTIGFSGRYSDPRKRISLLLDAVALLRDQGRPVRLELTGEGESSSFLEPLIQARGLGERVLRHPRLEPQELAATMQRWDLFVIPSHQEGLCIAALEAMACGCPVVSTHCGGPEEFVLEERTGRFCGESPAAMAAAITALAADRRRRNRLGVGARAWIEAQAGNRAGRATIREQWHLLYPQSPRGTDP
jgi:glycosyltransferase involved in cell wall biosynthesis